MTLHHDSAQATIVRVTTTGADLDGVLAIENASFNNPTTRAWYEAELLRPEVCFVYVMRTLESPVAAFCAFWLVGGEAHINQLAVMPELRERGYGRQLIEAVVIEAAHLGARSLTLEVRESNLPALRLYERTGFTRHGVRQNYYTSPVEHALVLGRDTK